MKILKIDAFAAPKRFLEMDGQKYPVNDINVQTFIDSLKRAEEIEAKAKIAGKVGEPTPLEALEAVVASIVEAIPTLPIDKVRALSSVQMGMVMDFIRGELDSEVADAEGAETSAGTDKS